MEMKQSGKCPLPRCQEHLPQHGLVVTDTQQEERCPAQIHRLDHVKGRRLVFNGFTLQPVPLHRGIDQGCLLLGILFQFYNADLIDSYDPKDGETAVAFIYDTVMLAWERTLAEANNKLRDMMEHPNSRLELSHNHYCEFMLDKFGVMGLTRKRELNPGERPCTRLVQRFPIPLQG